MFTHQMLEEIGMNDLTEYYGKPAIPRTWEAESARIAKRDLEVQSERTTLIPYP